MGLSGLLQAGLLVLNAMCVLHEERFLARSTVLRSNPSVIHIIRSVRTVMKVPLLLINPLVILKMLLLG